MRLCQGVGYLNALGVYFIDTESISGINNSRKNRVRATASTQKQSGSDSFHTKQSGSASSHTKQIYANIVAPWC